MDPFHVVRLAGDKLTTCRTRLQRETTGRRGREQRPALPQPENTVAHPCSANRQAPWAA
ncbi:transposase [Corynebacterium diphtheriae bv. mitis]|uniref:transposase n=1 Tax=Corynebacterium diphtheriae TaxID=1717 RepID=UPI001160C58B|nr:transposase [Corynebacterium diphtheriae bv. mitis]